MPLESPDPYRLGVAQHARADAYLSSACFSRPRFIAAASAWIEHAPFAFWLVSNLRPRSFVELGTHGGYSYFAVCQAVEAQGLSTQCYAVDHWKGDEHAGLYGEVVFARVDDHNKRHYSAFSRLVRSTFDEAVAHFPDRSIDLLHIDGRHFFEDVAHDFETWRPKLSERAVVLFHDTNVRERGFGVFRLWQELAAGYANAFEFHHAHGLGVLGYGSDLPAGVVAFFEAVKDTETAREARRAYARLGGVIRAEIDAQQAALQLADMKTRLESELARHRDEAQRALAEAAAGRTLLAQKEQALSEAQTRLTALASAAAEAEKRAGSLCEAVDERTARLAATERRISDLEAAMVGKEQQAAELGRALDRGSADLAHARDRIASLERLLAAREGELARSEKRVARIKRTLSWQLTAPFRELYRPLERLQETRLGVKLHAALRHPRNSRKRKAFRANRMGEYAAVRQALPSGEPSYADWIARNDTLTDRDRSLIRSHIASLQIRPKFSVIMPVYDTPENYLREALDSVLAQLYPDWELCVADDASPSPAVRRLLEAYAKRDPRIRPVFREVNGGIAACSNSALEAASGDWVVLLDHDDTLSEHALYLVANAINENPDAAIIYSDEDKIDAVGLRYDPYFKSDWNYELFLGQNLISHLGAYRADLARQVGGFREGFDGSQDWDFALRILDSAPDVTVCHIPFVLYHWRQTAGTFSATFISRARAAAERALNDHFARTGQLATAIPIGHSSHTRIARNLPSPRPLVSVVIPTKNKMSLLRTCIDGLTERTDYEPLEIVVVDNGSDEDDALAYLATLRQESGVLVIRDGQPFNFSRLVNLGVASSSGEICVLLNNDVDVINSDWLNEMVAHVLRPEVGAVGAKLIFANQTLQHGGVILGYSGVAGHAHVHAPRDFAGYFNRLNLAHELSCVTGACLAIRREVYEQVGGFNVRDLAVSFNDVDFCLRVRQAGYKIIWTPKAELYHYESLSRGRPDATPEGAARNNAEISYMRRQWGPILDNDPYFSPNLARDSLSFDIAPLTRAARPWLQSAIAHSEAARCRAFAD